MVNPWIQFLISAAIIIYAGSKLTRNAAVVAENTGIGSAWVGAMLLPLATSLPELVTTLTAVSIDAPDLALGNLLGSCLYNLALLAMLDMLIGRGNLTARLIQGHIVTVTLSIMTLSLVSIAMLGILVIPVGWIGLESVIIAMVYIFGSRLIYRYEQKNALPSKRDEHFQDNHKLPSTRLALLQFMAAAVIIIAAGVVITDAADRIAITTGLGHSFVGSIFLAISTGLPETVTTVSAMRLGYLDMAVANVFGANVVNVFLVFWADLLYLQAPLLSRVLEIHLLSSIMIIMLSAVFVFGLVYRSERKLFRVGFDSWLILAGYLMTVYLIFIFGGN